MYILELKNVSFAYQSKRRANSVINDISYAFDRGKFYAISGKSGCGKTTLISLMAGLAMPAKGDVLYRGNPISQIDTNMYRRENVAVVYQSYNLLPLLTVLENVMYPLQLSNKGVKEAKIIASEKLLSLGLDKQMFKRFPSTLSGGEQQRVTIARALCTKADVILADEPTGNLDIENGHIVISLLKKLAYEHQYCVIVVTHDTDIANEADIALHMVDGSFRPAASPGP